VPAERCRVGVVLNGANQFFQRDTERRSRDGKGWECVPFFVLNRYESITMSEAIARVLVNKLRSLGATSAWIEDAKDGRRIDVPPESEPQSGEDTRQQCIASLDDITWYIVRPTCTPNGRQWFITMFVPGLPERTTIYANDPLAVLQRAADMNYLQFVEKYQRPEPQQETPIQNNRGFRRRPGDL
jgi:hypothetical protein